MSVIRKAFCNYVEMRRGFELDSITRRNGLSTSFDLWNTVAQW